ncbi:MAG: hypothetical protein Tsb0021_02760 [Chlamydiales bacterium]
MHRDLNVFDKHIETHYHFDHREQSNFDPLINIIEKISAIALGALSFYINRQLFVPFFFVGVCIGIYGHIKDKNTCSGHPPVSSCAHGLLEQLTGVKLPPVITLIANISVTVCHIDHHATVFVPIIGISLGNWIGKTAAQHGFLPHKKITAYLTP